MQYNPYCTKGWKTADSTTHTALQRTTNFKKNLGVASKY